MPAPVDAAYRSNVPLPANPEDTARWEEAKRREAILSSRWKELARDAIRKTFDTALADQIQAERPDLSVNPLKFFASELASLYIEPPTVSAPEADAEELKKLTPPQLWANLQTLNQHVTAINDGVLRLDWSAERNRVTFRRVPASRIANDEASDDNPMQPVYLEELRWRADKAAPAGGWWTWDVWDLRDPSSPVFRIEKDGEDGNRVDVTPQFYAEAASQPYPYLDREGRPIMPYIYYHRRLQSSLWEPEPGMEVVEGTLTAAVLRSFWVYAYLSSSSPQNYGIDLEPIAAKPQTGASGQVVTTAQGGPGSVAFFKRTQPGGGFGSLSASLNPLDGIKALQQYVGDLAIFMGLSPADVTVESTSSASGASLRVRQEGKRKEAKGAIPSFRLSDQLTLSSAARMWNAYASTNLPEDPEAYTIGYQEIAPSPEEIQARINRAKSMKDTGIAGRVDLLLVYHPEMTRESALGHIVQVAVEEQQIEVAIQERLQEEGLLEQEESSAEEVMDSATEAAALLSALERADDATRPEIIADLRETLADLLEALGGTLPSSPSSAAPPPEEGEDTPPMDGENTNAEEPPGA